MVGRAVAELLNDLFRFVDGLELGVGEGSGCFCMLDAVVLWFEATLRPGECIDCDDSLVLSRQYIGDGGC